MLIYNQEPNLEMLTSLSYIWPNNPAFPYADFKIVLGFGTEILAGVRVEVKVQGASLNTNIDSRDCEGNIDFSCAVVSGKFEFTLLQDASTESSYAFKVFNGFLSTPTTNADVEVATYYYEKIEEIRSSFDNDDFVLEIFPNASLAHETGSASVDIWPLVAGVKAIY